MSNTCKMNAPIVNDAFQFVRSLYKKYLPLGFRAFQLDQGMELKNLCTSIGLRQGLSDDEMEILALAALLHNIGSIEGEFENREVSKAIAERYLQEQNYPVMDIFQVLACIAATRAESTPRTRLSGIIQAAKFSNVKGRDRKREKKDEVGDLWP